MNHEPIELPIEDRLDLHTFQPKDVKSVVQEYIYQAQQMGFRQVRIIHGRGIGVLRELVRNVLSRDPAVAAFADEPDRGSTTVTLKPNP